MQNSDGVDDKSQYNDLDDDNIALLNLDKVNSF